MKRAGFSCVGVVFLCAINPCVAIPQASTSNPGNVSAPRAILNRYCVTCHNEKLKTANLMLDQADAGKPSTNAELWEKVIRKLRTGAMPPAGMPRPDTATYDSLATYLETELDRAVAINPNPGRPAVHRLNRAEYANVIHDLLGSEIDVSSLLPADDSGYGFDNIGDVLSISPLLLERYMSAARRVSRLAIGDASLRPAEQTYFVPRELLQDERMSEELPFGTRGGMALHHQFPLDGEYVLKIHLKRTYDGAVVLGDFTKPHQIEARVDDARIKLLTVGGGNSGNAVSYQDTNALDPRGELKSDLDAGLEFRFPVKAGPHTIGIAFLNQHVSKPEGVLHLREPAALDDLAEQEPSLGSITIDGPYDAKGAGDTPTRRRIFLCRPSGPDDEARCAKKVLSALAHRAYRRPLTDEDVQPLLKLYDAGRSKRGFEAGVERALRAILVSPDFLFRIERDPPNVAAGAAYPISDVELASRLSFFVWSSLPDDELLHLAESGKLQSAAVLEQQVRRMMADPRSKALVNNFGGQWLYLRNMQKLTPNPKEFPEFDENLRQAMQRETEFFFQSMLREDRSVTDLLDANYTFVNDRLARHYGIPNIYGSHFRRIILTDENRRGLLGQGSILTVTSYANRTSPTLRGKWLLDNILGAPPPPPPANVPSLKDRGEDGKILSVRQQMEQHRKNPACATCHARMDPLGFALENFDALGKWRTSASNTPIDSSGVLPDGTKFNGPAELRQILLSRREQFVTVVTEKLLTYALGRGIEYYDQPAVRKIMREAASGNYRWSSIILGVVNSKPFRMRKARPS